MNVAIVGVVGYPANYGGFETLVKFLVETKSKDIEYLIFCDSTLRKRQSVYESDSEKCKNVTVKYLSLKANGWQSLLYDSISIFLSCLTCDRILILGTSGTFILPFVKFLFPKKKFITNIAGLEWSREKWNGIAKKILKLNESFAVRYSDVVIADNEALVDYVQKCYNINPIYIAYGGSQYQHLASPKSLDTFTFLPSTYDLAMARCQPDNNIELILTSYASSKKNIVFVSNWDGTEFSKKMFKKFSRYPNITLTGPYYEPIHVKFLFDNCRAYVHGHKCGGTNPVLVEAIFHQRPIVAFDVSFNRKTTFDKALYFSCAETLEQIILNFDLEIPDQHSLYELGKRHYHWKTIVEQYEKAYF